MAKVKTKAKAKAKAEEPSQVIELEEHCFHDYSEHLKRLQGGDYKKPTLGSSGIALKCPSGSELAAFLDIGAEAERRNELQFQQMKCCIDNLTQENENLRKENATKTNTTVSLKKKIAENENVIMSLTSEIDQLSCRLLQNKDVQNLSAQFECERDLLVKENERINCQLKQLKWKFIQLKQEHSNCSTYENTNEVQFLGAQEGNIRQMNELLQEKDNQLRKITCELQNAKEKNCALELKINSLEEQLQRQSEEFAEKSCTYQKAIEDLESQVTFLEENLSSTMLKLKYKKFISKLKDSRKKRFQKSSTYRKKVNDFYKDNAIYDEIANQPMDLQETYIADQLTEQDRILQELVAKIELRDRNFEQLKNLQNSQCMISEKEYNQLVTLIEDQANEINQLTCQLQKMKGEDSESLELWQEVTELQNAVCDSAAEAQSVDSLSRRIRRIKCKIKSRIQREEARRKEVSRQLGIYRCQFVTLQKEIEELRHTNPTTTKDEIKIRVEKEKALSQVICHVNKQRRELISKITAFEKALMNIEKVNEFVVQMS